MTEKPADARMNRRRQRPPFEVALRADAARIPARITAGMDKRLEAALARERPREAVPVRRESFVRPWLAGSLVGLGAAAMVVLLIGRIGNEAPVPAATPDVVAADGSSEFLQSFREQVPLNARTAELTAPLEEELKNLKSDLEKARENVERDLQLTF